MSEAVGFAGEQDRQAKRKDTCLKTSNSLSLVMVWLHDIMFARH